MLPLAILPIQIITASCWESAGPDHRTSSAGLVHLGQMTHQAPLTAGSIVLMDNAFFSSLIQSTDGGKGGAAGIFRRPRLDTRVGVLDEGAGAAGHQAIAQAALVILFYTFNCRLGISQLVPPKTLLKLKHAIVHERGEFVQFSLT